MPSRVFQYISHYLLSWQTVFPGIPVPWWFCGINKSNCEVLQTWECQQKNTGLYTSGAFFPNKILFPSVCFSLVTTIKPHLNHTYYRWTWTPVCAADKEGIIKQLFVEQMSILCSLSLLLSWVIALLTALPEGEVGITHTCEAENIFNSSATQKLETLTQTSLWNLIGPCNRIPQVWKVLQAADPGEIQLLRAVTAPTGLTKT